MPNINRAVPISHFCGEAPDFTSTHGVIVRNEQANFRLSRCIRQLYLPRLFAKTPYARIGNPGECRGIDDGDVNGNGCRRTRSARQLFIVS